MMHTERTPVSEVLRNAEAQISRANDTRRRAAELYAQAARLQEEAYADAVAELGEEDGASTYRLACRSVGADPSDRTGALSPTPAVHTPVATSTIPPLTAPAGVAAASVAEPEIPAFRPAPEASVVPMPAPDLPQPATVTATKRDADVTAVPPTVPPVSSQSDDPSRLERYGVLIKRSKLAEAEEVIAQAQRTISQNRKTNPYADDRGRNAWRNTLFAAVLAQGGVADGTSETATRITPESEPHEAAPQAGRPLPVASSVRSDEAVRMDGEDDVLDDVLPSRAVPYTRNPAQSDAVDGRPDPAVPARQSPRVNGPAGRSTTGVAPEVHVSRPIQNRPVGFGQAVPAPPGLSDTISRLNAGQPGHASSPVTTPKPPPTRPAPPFIKSK